MNIIICVISLDNVYIDTPSIQTLKIYNYALEAKLQINFVNNKFASLLDHKNRTDCTSDNKSYCYTKDVHVKNLIGYL